jgi:hypothetical protein
MLSYLRPELRVIDGQAPAVVDENGGGSDVHIEVVVIVAGDGEVPHPAVVVGRDRASHYDRCLAVRGLELLARFELFSRDPLVQ